MQETVEQTTTPGNSRLNHDDTPARTQHSVRLVEESRREFEMMQDIHHNNVRCALLRERQAMRVRDAVEPGNVLDVGRNHVVQATFEIANAGADFDRGADKARGRDADVKIVVNELQDRLLIPGAAVFLQAT